MKIIRAAEPPKVTSTGMRRVWSPGPDAKTVALSCGHYESNWGLVKALGNLDNGGLLGSVWCGKCAAQVTVDHYASAAESVGIQILPMPDNPPF